MYFTDFVLKCAARVLGHDIWKHVKRGTFYFIIEDNATWEKDKQRVVVYKNIMGGKVWVRPYDEFFDGRFVRVGIAK